MNLQEDAENFVDGTSRQQKRVNENGNKNNTYSESRKDMTSLGHIMREEDKENSLHKAY